MRVVFMGSPEFAVPCLRALADSHEVVLVVSQPDKPAGRGSQLTAPPVKVAALELGLPVIQPRSAKTGELRDALVATGAELAVVVAYGKILPPAVLEALPRGCINVHASILPRYRGAAPVQWAVIHGDAETGVAIMQLDPGMDTGPVLLERRITIDPTETSGELLARLAPIGAQAMLDAIAGLAAETLHPVAQDHAAATHAPMLEKTDGLIDFTAPAHAVAARIRGVDPWPGAQALHRSQIVKLFRATARPQPPGAELPGTVIAIDDAGLHVVCGEDVAVIREIQAPGRKRLTVAQFAAGRGIAVGDVLSRPAETAPAPVAGKPPA
ncbi:MAG: methionyl-tRNA formyltransferase [Myxococcales bacterium]|nr:methionyl-tRNA formyltransferase [Myxococcales bacterium]